MLALREGLEYNRITSSVWSDRMEIIAVELESQRSKKCLVRVCYRPPNYDLKDWLNLFVSFLPQKAPAYSLHPAFARVRLNYPLK